MSQLRRGWLLVPLLVFAITRDAASSWYSNYNAIVSRYIPGYATVAPHAVRSAGYYAGWYGHAYYDYQHDYGVAQRNYDALRAYVPSDPRDGPLRLMFYWEPGEIGDFYMGLGPDNSYVTSAWQWETALAKGYPVDHAAWFGTFSFHQNQALGGFPTRDTYPAPVPTLTRADGTALPDPPSTATTAEVEQAAQEFYAALAAKGICLNGQSYPTNHACRQGAATYVNVTTADRTYAKHDDGSSLTDAEANELKLSQIVSKTAQGWLVVRRWQVDHANLNLADFMATQAEWLIAQQRPDGFHVDDLGSTNLSGADKNAFGDWSVAQFVPFVQNRGYTTQQLTTIFGSSNVDNYDVVNHVRGLAATDSLDRVWNIYKIYKTTKSQEFFRQLYFRAKAKALTEGIVDAAGNLDFAVTGNVIPLWPGAALRKGAVDVPNFEWNAGNTPYSGFTAVGFPNSGVGSNGRAGYITRLGAKLGVTGYAWTSLYVPGTYAGKAPLLHKVMAFDAFANHGIMDYAYEFLGKVSPGTDTSAHEINEVINEVSRFDANIGTRQFMADVGLLFDPWAQVAETPIATPTTRPHADEYQGWAKFFADRQVQWDVLPTSEVMSVDALKRFKVIVVPSVCVVTLNVADLLEAYVTAGSGRLIVTGNSGTRMGSVPNGDLQPWSDGRNVFQDAARSPGFVDVRTAPTEDDRLPGRAYLAASTQVNGDRLAVLLGTYDKRLTSVKFSDPTIGPYVGANVNRFTAAADGKAVLTVDLNNYNYSDGGDADPDTEQIQPMQVANFSIRVPVGFGGATYAVSYLTDDAPTLAPFPGQVKLLTGGIFLQVSQAPAFDHYAIFIIKFTNRCWNGWELSTC